MKSGSRPGILFIQADQHRYDCLGVHGHPQARTPHLDSLARDGIDCRHAFTPAPVCVPARTSLEYGCWPSRHGCLVNEGLGVPHADATTLATFPTQLRQAGYRLMHVGKWQVSRGTPPEALGYDTVVPPGAYARWRSDRGLPPRPHRNRWFGEVDPHIGPDESRLGWEATQVIGLLEQAAAGEAPFFIHWDCSEPHLPNIVPEPYASMVDPAALPPWPGFADSLAGKPYMQAQQRRTWGLEGWTWERWAPTVARYLGEISLLDAQIGRILEALTRLGLAAETLLVYSSDHGDLCGSHGMIDKHYVMYDDVTRVPLLLRWPAGITAPGRTEDGFVVHALDLARTFCELAGGEVPATFQGESLLPVLASTGSTARPEAFSVYYGNQFGLYTQRMVRDRRWKYVWNATAEDELYDLHADPGELHNLARSAGAAAQLHRLRLRLVDWMETTGDQQLNPWIRTQLVDNLKV